MNREILFRGKRTGNGDWIEGYCYRISDKLKPFIMLPNRHGESYEVITETVGQYTGLTDKSGNKIFEGDICAFDSGENISKYEIMWFGTKWVVRPAKSGIVDDLDLFFVERSEVIGNIHDNSELLEEN